MNEEVKLHIFSADLSTELNLPYVDNGIKAGFPSPAQDYLTESIDLNKTLIRHSETTFYAKVSGDSLMDAGISDERLESNCSIIKKNYTKGESFFKFYYYFCDICRV